MIGLTVPNPVASAQVALPAAPVAAVPTEAKILAVVDGDVAFALIAILVF